MKFQEILNQYKGNIKFNFVKDEIQISPDFFIYTLDTDKGVVYLIITDTIDYWEDFINSIQQSKLQIVNFIEVLHKDENFYDYELIKNVINKEGITISELKKFLPYVNKKYIDEEYYFSFLIV